MKSTSDRRSYLSKRTEDRTDPLSHGDGKGKPSSWQRSVKRKLPSSACELPPQARKVDSTLCTSQNLRPHRHLASIRKSLSDPLQVFGDCDESSSSQHRGSSRTNPSECKDRLPRDNEGRPDTLEDAENLSKEKRRWLKPGLKDSTNLDPKATLKQNNLHTYNEVMVLKETLHAEREAHRSLQTELDEERNAASSAANEAMSMIARLQEEKAAVLMEARQFKRMAEERELHNQEAISLLKEMLMNKEEEALALENELVACRQMFLAIEAGEPLQNMTPKYLDMENYSNSNQQTELVSCDSKQLSLYVNDRPRGSFKEEPIISEFSGRTFGRSLKGFASDSIRGNLEDFFNRAGESTEEMMNCNEMQYNKEWPGTMYDKVVDYSTSVDNSMSFIHGAIHGIGNGDTLEQIPSPSSGKSFSECQAEPPAFCTDEQSRSLWDRIMKLEHRLETFGVDGKGFEFDLPETIAPTPQTPGFTSCKQQVNASSLDPTSCSTLDPQKVDIVKRESVEMPGKLDCTGGSHGPEAEIEQLKGSEISSCRNQMQASLESQGRNTSHILAHPYDNFSDTVEGVHDVYEVGYQLNEGLHNECYRSPEVDSSHRAQLGSIEKPDSPSELMAPIMETMDVTPPDSAEVKNLSSSLSGAEIQQLNKRLQVLENEKHSMHQAILSLQAENKELRALEAVALELQDLKQSQNLKRTLQISELPNKRVKSEQPSFTSIFKGFFSYLPSGTNLENRSMALDLVSHSAQKDYVGLSRLLETSPHLKTETLIMRGLKVKVPAAI